MIVARSFIYICAAAVIAAAAGCATTTKTVAVQPRSSGTGQPTTANELRIAQAAMESGNLDMATSVYARIVKLDPTSSEGLMGLGTTLYAVGDYTRAAVLFEQAHNAAPTDIAPLVGLARVAIKQRRFDDAIAQYKAVLAKVPNDAISSAGLGAALDMKGDHAAAQSLLRSALAANPGDPMLSVNLGLSLVLGGEPRQGANVLLDVTRYPGAPSQARENLALAYGMLGNDQAAAEILGRDLPPASVQDNLRYYAAQRAQLVNGTAKAADAAVAGQVSAVSVPTSAVSGTPLIKVAAVASNAASRSSAAANVTLK